MDKTTKGLVIGAGIGLGLGWLASRGGKSDQERILILKKLPNGRPGLELSPDDVEVRAGKKLTWWVVNLTDLDVKVSFRNWRNHDDKQPRPAAVTADPDNDPEDPQVGLSRLVRAGKVKNIRGKARSPEFWFSEEVEYDVYLGDDLAVDPIVKLVL